MTTQELMNAEIRFLSVTAFSLMRHVKHHCKEHDAECRIACLQSELSSIRVSIVHTAPTGNSEYFVVKLHIIINFL